MRLYPAVDILAGNAVRLVRGDYEAKKVYDADPEAAARTWVEAAARRLHVVDLDGAKEGAPRNIEHLERIARLGVPVQYGGGLRTPEAVSHALAAGAERVVLGTGALTAATLLDSALAAHGPERVAVAVDVRGGQVVVDGWTKAAGADVESVFGRLIERGVQEFLYTNVDRDGMLGGPNLDDLEWVARQVGRHGRLVYSGGIGSLADLEALATLASDRGVTNLDGVIVGTALYEGRFTIASAHDALGD